ncbi:uncharacterized protein F5147DRAFT_837941 [Suillus discolor]|uniref:Uncharacterized protein n=1 Tax=Suillus discolor TaxID=1912936 RepID=A0A9P7JT60_9AGAM|nr:uncharacterized protein F5147DRAFT_837941 [Suillus discolor]KAG2106228.1 hypothetical protein F5147DRAFT_837941 [Suillus discolor]
MFKLRVKPLDPGHISFNSVSLRSVPTQLFVSNAEPDAIPQFVLMAFQNTLENSFRRLGNEIAHLESLLDISLEVELQAGGQGDIQAESAVKLLSEFLDLDTLYIEGQRHPNADMYLDILSQPCVLSTEELLPQPTFKKALQTISPKIAGTIDELTASASVEVYLILTSNDRRSHLDNTQEQLTTSTKVKGKEPEGHNTPPRGKSQHPSSSTPPRISGEFVPNAVIESQEIVGSYTPGNRKFNTPVESGLRPSLVP